MSGHSKFANIKHKKEKNDAAKGKIFTVIGREIAVAVKEGGPDPANNYKLAQIIAKIFKIPVIKTVNKLLGGILGACKGFAVVLFICTILTVFFASGDNELAAAVNDSVVVNLIDNVNPLVNSLKEIF